MNRILWAVVRISHILQKAHQCAKNPLPGGPKSHPSDCTLEVGRGQRHPPDALSDHCLLQAEVWMCSIWHSIQYQPTTTGQHPQHCINSLRPRQNGRHSADDIFKRIFLNENIRISIKISLKFVSKGLIKNIPALVLIMAWRRPGDKPLSEPMMVRSPTHICVTRPQWVKTGT